MRQRKLILIVAVIAALAAQPAQAATERMPCRSTEAKDTPTGAFVWVACPTEGRLMPEAMEVHFQGDKRDFVVRSAKLVPLDGPLGGTGPVAASRPDPRAAEALREARKVIDEALAKLAG